MPTIREHAEELGYKDQKVLTRELRTWRKENNLSKDEFCQLARDKLVALVDGFLKKKGSSLWTIGRIPCFKQDYDTIKSNLVEIYVLQQHHLHLNGTVARPKNGKTKYEVPATRRMLPLRSPPAPTDHFTGSGRKVPQKSSESFEPEEGSDSSGESQIRDSPFSVSFSDIGAEQSNQATFADDPSSYAPSTGNAGTCTTPAYTYSKRRFDEMEDSHAEDDTLHGRMAKRVNTFVVADVIHTQPEGVAKPRAVHHLSSSGDSINLRVSSDSQLHQASREASLEITDYKMSATSSNSTSNSTSNTTFVADGTQSAGGDMTRASVAGTEVVGGELPETRGVSVLNPAILDSDRIPHTQRQASPSAASKHSEIEVEWFNRTYTLNTEGLLDAFRFMSDYLNEHKLKDEQELRAATDKNGECAGSFKRLKHLTTELDKVVGRVGREKV